LLTICKILLSSSRVNRETSVHENTFYHLPGMKVISALMHLYPLWSARLFSQNKTENEGALKPHLTRDENSIIEEFSEGGHHLERSEKRLKERDKGNEKQFCEEIW